MEIIREFTFHAAIGETRYRWVNRTMFVGQGRATTDGVEYEIYRVA